MSGGLPFIQPTLQKYFSMNKRPFCYPKCFVYLLAISKSNKTITTSNAAKVFIVSKCFYATCFNSTEYIRDLDLTLEKEAK